MKKRNKYFLLKRFQNKLVQSNNKKLGVLRQDQIISKLLIKLIDNQVLNKSIKFFFQLESQSNITFLILTCKHFAIRYAISLFD